MTCKLHKYDGLSKLLKLAKLLANFNKKGVLLHFIIKYEN